MQKKRTRSCLGGFSGVEIVTNHDIRGCFDYFTRILVALPPWRRT